MLNIFNKKKIKLSTHDVTIAIDHLHIRQNQLKKYIKDNPDKDTWCDEHDIKCIERIILYLENKGG